MLGAMRALVLAVAITGVAALAGSASLGWAAFPGHDGWIAFVWNANTRVAPQSCQDIFSIEPNGSGRRRLTSGCPREYSGPEYSATGRRIVFVRAHELYSPHPQGAGIYVMSADGLHLRRITASVFDVQPSFSPTGRRIVFVRYLPGSRRTQIFLASANGSRVRELTHGAGATNPTFSPSGREIAFVRTDDSDIYTMRLDGSHVRQLTRARAYPGSWYSVPDFSPSGRRIVFVCGQGDGLGSIAQVCVMGADGSHLKHLTPAGRMGPVVLDAVFSPDGRQIALAAYRPCAHRCRNEIRLPVHDDGQRVRPQAGLRPRSPPGRRLCEHRLAAASLAAGSYSAHDARHITRQRLSLSGDRCSDWRA
jgi:Tol biopolymer transport system component